MAQATGRARVSGQTTTTVDVRGCRIRLMRAGRGQPLLLLRGTDASDDWLRYMDRLAERHEVLVPEHPGFGGEPAPAWLDTVGDLACFYLDLIDTLGLGRVHLAGTSLGGWIAADLAARDCHKLASLTLAAPAGLRVKGHTGLDLFMMSEADGLRARFHDPAKVEPHVARMLRPETEDVRLTNALTIARVSWQPRLWDPQLEKWLHRITVPSLVLWGEHDRVLPVEHARLWGRLLPKARVEIVPDCGHAVALERPQAFVGLLSGFIATLE